MLLQVVLFHFRLSGACPDIFLFVSVGGDHKAPVIVMKAINEDNHRTSQKAITSLTPACCNH